jgi:hypothetical protein
MTKRTTVDLDWQKLLAFDQAHASRNSGALSAKVGDKGPRPLSDKIGAKIGDKLGLKIGA